MKQHNLKFLSSASRRACAGEPDPPPDPLPPKALGGGLRPPPRATCVRRRPLADGTRRYFLSSNQLACELFFRESYLDFLKNKNSAAPLKKSRGGACGAAARFASQASGAACRVASWQPPRPPLPRRLRPPQAVRCAHIGPSIPPPPPAARLRRAGLRVFLFGRDRRGQCRRRLRPSEHDICILGLSRGVRFVGRLRGGVLVA